MSLNFSNCGNFNILLGFLVNLINGDAFISAAADDACSVVHLLCLFMKKHLLALLQGNYLYLVRCAFLRKLFACVRKITVFCQQLLRPINLADCVISVKSKYRPVRYIGLSRHATDATCRTTITRRKLKAHLFALLCKYSNTDKVGSKTVMPVFC